MEDPSNIGVVCGDCAPKVDKKLMKQAQENPKSFIGKFVKKGFPATTTKGVKDPRAHVGSGEEGEEREAGRSTEQ